MKQIILIVFSSMLFVISANDVVKYSDILSIRENPELYYINNSGCKSLFVLDEIITFDDPIIINYKYDSRYYISNRSDINLNNINQLRLLSNSNVYILLWDWPEALGLSVPSDILFNIYDISGEHSKLTKQSDHKKYNIYNFEKTPIYYQLLLIKGNYLNILSTPTSIDCISKDTYRDGRYFESLDSVAYYKCLMPVWREDKRFESFEFFLNKFSNNHQFQIERTDTSYINLIEKKIQYKFIEFPASIINNSTSTLNDGRTTSISYNVAGNRAYMKIYDHTNESYKNYSEFWFWLINKKWYLYFYYDRIELQKKSN